MVVVTNKKGDVSEVIKSFMGLHRLCSFSIWFMDVDVFGWLNHSTTIYLP